MATQPSLCRTLFRKCHGLDAFVTVFGRIAGTATSIRQIGPSRYNGPSDLTKAGALPLSTHACVSGGCFPMRGATTPATPPIFTLNDVVNGFVTGTANRECFLALRNDLKIDEARFWRDGDIRDRSDGSIPR